MVPDLEIDLMFGRLFGLEPHFQLWQVPHQLVRPMAFPQPDRRDQPDRQGHLRKQRRYSR
jgi:hypothetical protein